ncbi:MAG: hypothetical protein AAGH15_27275 [Myxococcota bacterium]
MTRWHGEPPPRTEAPQRTPLGYAPGLAGGDEYDPYGLGDPRLSAGTLLGPERGELSKLDRLATRIAGFGAAVLLFLHVAIVPEARGLYVPFRAGTRGLTAFAYAPGFAVTGVLLTLFLAFFGTRMRRLGRKDIAGPLLFLAIASAIAFNAILVTALFDPAGGSLDGLRQD